MDCVINLFSGLSLNLILVLLRSALPSNLYEVKFVVSFYVIVAANAVGYTIGSLLTPLGDILL